MAPSPAESIEGDDWYNVVRNAAEQYSIWRRELLVPSGWEIVGIARPKSECLAWIDENWTGLRPAAPRNRETENSSAVSGRRQKVADGAQE